MIRNEEHMHKD